jgi:hypothetical protein
MPSRASGESRFLGYQGASWSFSARADFWTPQGSWGFLGAVFSNEGEGEAESCEAG